MQSESSPGLNMHFYISVHFSVTCLINTAVGSNTPNYIKKIGCLSLPSKTHNIINENVFTKMIDDGFPDLLLL